MRHRQGMPVSGEAGDTGYGFFLGRPARPEETFGGAPDDPVHLGWFRSLERQRIVADGTAAPDNDHIPAGYTYLGQLVAHDLSFDALPAVPSQPPRNLRSPALDLDCIYGGGPDRSRALYEVAGAHEDSQARRTRLRLGNVRLRGGVASRCPVFGAQQPHDLPRVNVASRDNNTPDQWRFDTPERWEALIADARNEDNLILSQLVVLFHRFHNRVVDRLLEVAGGLPDHLIFEQARALVVTAYQKIVTEDYLRLVLEPKQYRKYAKLSHEQWLKRTDKWMQGDRLLLPIEFAHAAMRFGHAMIRKTYDLNNVLRHVSPGVLLEFDGSSASNVPISPEWVVDWSRFFNMGGRASAGRRMHSKAIGPLVVRSLFEHRTLKEAADGPEAERGGLLFRDLQRALANRLFTGPAMAEALKCTPLTRDEIVAHLPAAGGSWPAEAVERFVTHTPLLYYVLAEAAVKHQGRHLGALGTQLVGEVIFGVCARSRQPDTPEATDLAGKVFGADGVPGTMPALIRFATA